jgi:hypothetical protein
MQGHAEASMDDMRSINVLRLNSQYRRVMAGGTSSAKLGFRVAAVVHQILRLVVKRDEPMGLNS